MFKRILVVVDALPASRTAVAEGTELARVHGAELVFFSVLPRYSVPVVDAPPFVMVSPEEFLGAAKANAERLLAAAKVVADRAQVRSTTTIGSSDDDTRCIVETVRKRRCDLVVVGSEGRNALLRLLTGSVIPGLITASPVPVMVCKARERAKPGARAKAVLPKARRAAKRTAGGTPAA